MVGPSFVSTLGTDVFPSPNHLVAGREYLHFDPANIACCQVMPGQFQAPNAAPRSC
jgi:hypothetical protein